MSSSFFDFKQFRVYHNQCAMKVGTDSVLLGALATLVGSEQTLLDIGTGSGLLALMLAQRSGATIDALEIDEAACGQASENFAQSPWSNRLCARQISLQEFSKNSTRTYDFIVSNPPYFEAGKNYSMNDKQRSLARHDGDLSFQDLAVCVTNLLRLEGVFWLILPVAESQLFKQIAQEQQLFLVNQLLICPKAGKPANRAIMGFRKVQEPLRESIFTIKNVDGKPTQDYLNATNLFYL